MSEQPARPEFSIIIPVFNEAPGINGFLSHLQPHRSLGTEIVVVDGGSTDQTVVGIDSLSDQIIVAPRGRALQMHAGALASRGRILLFLHADTRFPSDIDWPDFSSCFSGNFRWGFCAVRLSGKLWGLRVVERLMNWRSHLSGIGTGDQLFIVERNLYFEVGGFPKIPLMEDIALSKRLKKQAGHPANIGITVTTSSRRWEKHGVAKTVLLMWVLRLKYFLGVPPDRLHKQYYR